MTLIRPVTLIALLFLTGAAGARTIRNIEIVREQVFEPGELPWGVEGPMNALHALTGESVIRRDLLFSEGEPLDTLLVSETARLLRSRPYLADVQIDTQPVGEDSVDIAIQTRDLWTLELSLSPSGGGGAYSLSLGLSDLNFRGRAQELYFGYTISDRRPTGFFGFADPALFGTHVFGALSYNAHGDGNSSRARLVHPLWAVTVPWQYGISWESNRDNLLFYKQDQDAFAYPFETRGVQAEVGRAWGRLWRFLLFTGVRWEQNEFGQPFVYADVPPELAAESTYFQAPDAKRVVPSMAARVERQGFRTVRFLDRFGRTEDFPVSLGLNVLAGSVSRVLGSSVGRTQLGAQVQAGAGRTGLWVNAEARVVYESDAPEREGSTQVQSALRLYLQPAVRHTLAIHARHDGWYRANYSGQMFLGALTGVRGLTARYRDGTRRWYVNGEYRFFSPFRALTVDLGAVVFTDLGQVWNRSESLRLKDAVWTYGAGLRLGLSKLANERIFRIDLAHGPSGWVTTFGFGMYFTFGLDQPLRFGT